MRTRVKEGWRSEEETSPETWEDRQGPQSLEIRRPLELVEERLWGAPGKTGLENQDSQVWGWSDTRAWYEEKGNASDVASVW